MWVLIAGIIALMALGFITSVAGMSRRDSLIMTAVIAAVLAGVAGYFKGRNVK